MISDGFCNDETNTVECDFDGGDCCGACIVTKFCSECVCLGNSNSTLLSNPLIGDGFCDDEINTVDCGYDGGDCCGSCVITKRCLNCACIDNVTVNVTNVLIGNSVCNDETNNHICNYDGGDCCSYSYLININKCFECICHHKETCIAGFHPLVGNGNCDHETNIIECSYDFGECCSIPDLVGNEICNDEANNLQCNFDGGDCCLLIMNTNECSKCECSSYGIITSPGFPENNKVMKDLEWLIQLPLGQYIEFNFLTFELESKLISCM